MASIIPKLLFIGNAQAGSVYTAPTTEGSYSIVKSVNICNTSASPSTFSINLLESGQALSTSNAILANIDISGGNVFSYETSIVVPAGASLNISQPDNSLTFTISGVEYAV